ncbi:type II toxin-antitoxin system prevent-host-death family antitoxin [Phenylobacterium sp.]|uniref:type II toxin-antitoxin system Phd/YefM family antitoxin n=1 Tax=Phenylobacterium sp. TaxID=1871053 RepID=UPI0025D5B490|nr:type II toxin-antitoxin system prevent-host-death family antitoxin [Phenylobacterium sp.]
MVIANIHLAKTNLSKLIAQAEAGEEVVIARDGKPAVRLTPVEAVVSVDEPRRPDGLPAWMRSMKGQIWISPDFDAYDDEIARLFDESEIFPKDDPET